MLRPVLLAVCLPGLARADVLVTFNQDCTGGIDGWRLYAAQLVSSTSRLWPTGVPVVVDTGPDGTGPVELGVVFSADVPGYVAGVRFYKALANTGVHIANLWTDTGPLLASAPFTAETPSGWQEVAFASPVPIAADTGMPRPQEATGPSRRRSSPGDAAAVRTAAQGTACRAGMASTT
jgi:hypothetical protein